MTKKSRKRKADLRMRFKHLLPASPTISAGEDGVPKIAILAYNADSALSVRGFDAPVVIDLSTASLERSVTKINRNHEQDREIGHATGKIDASGIYFDGLLSVPGQDRDEIVEASKNDFPWDASIEASFPKAEFVSKSKSVVVNGHRQSGVYVARNAVLTGVAILNRGADRQTVVSIAAKHKDVKEMNPELKSYIEAQGFDPETVENNDSQLQFLTAQFKSSQVAPPSLPSDSFSGVAQKQRDSQADEAQRVSRIRTICAKYNDPEIDSEDGNPVSLAAHAIKTGMTEKECELEARLFDLDNKSSGHSAPAFHDATKNDQDAQVIEASMVMAAGGVSEEDIKKNGWYDERIMNEAKSKRFKGFRVSRLAFQTMQAAGIYHPPGQLDDQYIQASVQAHHKLMASGFTTLSLPGIMSNVANKTLLAAYTRAPSFIPFVFGQASATDFKPLYSYQLEGSGMLEKLAQDAEMKHGKLVESQYTKKLETYAKMLAFTRQDMINDDMSALTRVATMLGTMSFKAREFAATQTIANSTMFSAGNGNLITANTLGIDGLTASGVAFDGQTDTDGLPIGVDGGRLLAPASLKVVTSQLQNQTEIRDSATGKNFINNPHAGMFDGFNTQWLDNSIATASAAGVVDANRSKTWYRFADPGAAAAFEVVYLNGQDSPTIQSAETSFNTLGMQWRCFFDFGFGENDPKMAQKNVGV
jgi:hypothetical protein